MYMCDLVSVNSPVEFCYILLHVYRYTLYSWYIVPALCALLVDVACRYPRARSFKRRFVFHAGPTNSGKTHNALETFLGAHSAIYCAPLRMLAHEIYRRSNERGIPCDLLTGDEKQFASGNMDPSNHMSCTVEMADLDSYCECVPSLSSVLVH